MSWEAVYFAVQPMACTRHGARNSWRRSRGARGASVLWVFRDGRKYHGFFLTAPFVEADACVSQNVSFSSNSTDQAAAVATFSRIPMEGKHRSVTPGLRCCLDSGEHKSYSVWQLLSKALWDSYMTRTFTREMDLYNDQRNGGKSLVGLSRWCFSAAKGTQRSDGARNTSSRVCPPSLNNQVPIQRGFDEANLCVVN